MTSPSSHLMRAPSLPSRLTDFLIMFFFQNTTTTIFEHNKEPRFSLLLRLDKADRKYNHFQDDMSGLSVGISRQSSSSDAHQSSALCDTSLQTQQLVGKHDLDSFEFNLVSSGMDMLQPLGGVQNMLPPSDMADLGDSVIAPKLIIPRNGSGISQDETTETVDAAYFEFSQSESQIHCLKNTNKRHRQRSSDEDLATAAIMGSMSNVCHEDNLNVKDNQQQQRQKGEAGNIDRPQKARYDVVRQKNNQSKGTANQINDSIEGFMLMPQILPSFSFSSGVQTAPACEDEEEEDYGAASGSSKPNVTPLSPCLPLGLSSPSETKKMTGEHLVALFPAIYNSLRHRGILTHRNCAVKNASRDEACRPGLLTTGASASLVTYSVDNFSDFRRPPTIPLGKDDEATKNSKKVEGRNGAAGKKRKVRSRHSNGTLRKTPSSSLTQASDDDLATQSHANALNGLSDDAIGGVKNVPTKVKRATGSRKRAGGYKCSRCGQIKSKHICKYVSHVVDVGSETHGGKIPCEGKLVVVRIVERGGENWV